MEERQDLISRQAAIDALGEKPLAWTEGEYEIGLQNQWEADVNAIKALQPEQRWIPVSERLPEGSDIVLLSLPPHIDPDGEECFASVICGHYIGCRDAEWGLSDGDTFGYGLVSVRKGTNPVAWMPLPEPWRGEQE